jgi:hypothetical protein
MYFYTVQYLLSCSENCSSMILLSRCTVQYLLRKPEHFLGFRRTVYVIFKGQGAYNRKRICFKEAVQITFKKITMKKIG